MNFNHRPYTDKYFLRSKEILLAEDINPIVTYQVFFRKTGCIFGIEEAVNFIRDAADYGKFNVKINALSEGDEFTANETVMFIEGRLIDLIDLETVYLGIISARTSERNDLTTVDLDSVRRKAKQIKDICKDKQLMYFGARHWHYSMDKEISKAALDAGFDACATDIGAMTHGNNGVGTIPHALVIAYGAKFGKSTATLRAARAFDNIIDKKVPRIALIDTFNREIDDSISVADAIPNIWGVRIDTAGEIFGQGCKGNMTNKFIDGPGVSVELVKNVRFALDKAGHKSVNIVLSSGFGNVDKLKTFVHAEQEYGRLFESIGIGGLYNSRIATADIVKVDGKEFSKTGRSFKANPRLRPVLS
ncbi:nicotinate phosphoribosyltransferase [Candidatus Woesearchaeota archaeon]|nr:nicotinate phosphoribosyltransferase [Candidatus Woesearchaeota archaeon]